MTDEDKIRIIKDSVELNKHQNQLQDPNILPCISIEDIPTETEKVEYKTYKLAHGNIYLNKVFNYTTLISQLMVLHL